MGLFYLFLSPMAKFLFLCLCALIASPALASNRLESLWLFVPGAEGNHTDVCKLQDCTGSFFSRSFDLEATLMFDNTFATNLTVYPIGFSEDKYTVNGDPISLLDATVTFPAGVDQMTVIVTSKHHLTATYNLVINRQDGPSSAPTSQPTHAPAPGPGPAVPGLNTEGLRKLDLKGAEINFKRTSLLYSLKSKEDSVSYTIEGWSSAETVHVIGDTKEPSMMKDGDSWHRSGTIMLGEVDTTTEFNVEVFENGASDTYSVSILRTESENEDDKKGMGTLYALGAVFGTVLIVFGVYFTMKKKGRETAALDSAYLPTISNDDEE